MHPEGREYYTWPVVSDVDPVPAIQLSIDGVRWFPTQPVSGGIRALVAGPDAERILGANPPDTIVLRRERRNVFLARAVDNPEVIIRTSGSISCTRVAL